MSPEGLRTIYVRSYGCRLGAAAAAEVMVWSFMGQDLSKAVKSR